MSRATVMPTSRAPSIVALVNPIVRRLLGAGLAFGPNVLLTVRGRSTGHPHTFPIALLEADGRRFVQSPFGEVNWVRNLRAAGEATVTIAGRPEPVTATELSAEAGALALREAVAPSLRSRLGRLGVRRFVGVGPESTLDDYIAIVREHPMFELRSVDAASGPVDG